MDPESKSLRSPGPSEGRPPSEPPIHPTKSSPVLVKSTPTTTVLPRSVSLTFYHPYRHPQPPGPSTGRLTLFFPDQTFLLSPEEPWGRNV